MPEECTYSRVCEGCRNQNEENYGCAATTLDKTLIRAIMQARMEGPDAAELLPVSKLLFNRASIDHFRKTLTTKRCPDSEKRIRSLLIAGYLFGRGSELNNTPFQRTDDHRSNRAFGIRVRRSHQEADKSTNQTWVVATDF